MSLAPYRKKRDFSKTREPKGKITKKTSKKENKFIVQKHDASHLHYDFRLEIEGVLVSWVIPKGPTLSTREKRLAIRTEDHPLSYANFEGIIPQGSYGAGTVLLWDTGVYVNAREISIRESLKEGLIEIILKGKRLKGLITLVRTRVDKDGKDRWLWMKKKDKYAQDEIDVIQKYARSVKSKKTLEEIQKGE